MFFTKYKGYKMQKILGSVALAGALFVANANAADVKPFAGLEVGKTSAGEEATAEIPSKGFSYSASDSVGGVFIGFKGGAILDDMHRLSLHLATHGYKDADATSIVAGYDYLHRVNDRAKLFAGVHLGSLSLDIDEDDDDDFEYGTVSGAMYGFQFGYIHELDSNFEFEVGLKYSIVSADKTYSNPIDSVPEEHSIKYKIKNALMIGVGFNYKF